MSSISQNALFTNLESFELELGCTDSHDHSAIHIHSHAMLYIHTHSDSYINLYIYMQFYLYGFIVISTYSYRFGCEPPLWLDLTDSQDAETAILGRGNCHPGRGN